MKSIFKYLPLLAFIALVSGCAKYRPKPLAFQSDGSVHEKGSVEISSKALNDLECENYFDRKIVSKGYQPIQISIKNKTNKTYVLNASDITLPIEKVKKVSKKIHHNVVGRVAGWGVAGLFFWPFFIPAAIEGVNTVQANNDMDDDLIQRSIDKDDHVIVGPHAVINKVIFVPLKNYHSHFNMDLVSRDDGQKLTFNM